MNTHQMSVSVPRLLAWFAALAFAWIPASDVASVERSARSPGKQVAIVIDDLGNDMAGTKEIMELPIPLTVAVMPFLPTSKRDAEWAHRVGHQVFVHLPMEPVKGKPSWLGPGAITSDLSDEEIRRRVNAAVDEIPFAVGINNHMGSKATADERVMRIVMDVCRQRGLIYLDSRTTDRRVPAKLAREMGVPFAENHLFLDDVYTKQHVLKQVQKIRRLLGRQDRCIAIGHVGPPGKKTAEGLRESIPVLRHDAVFVRVSDIAETPAASP